MNEFESLLDMVSEEVRVIEGPILQEGYEGLYRDNYIFLEKSLPTIRKKERLMEEYSHHKTSVGNIINYSTTEERKQELKARRLALETLVPLDRLVACSFAGCRTNYDCAEYLDVTVETLEAAFQHYTAKFGSVHLHQGCIIHFNGDSAIVVNTGLQ